jgi:hypothetical protein
MLKIKIINIGMIIFYISCLFIGFNFISSLRYLNNIPLYSIILIISAILFYISNPLFKSKKSKLAKLLQLYAIISILSYFKAILNGKNSFLTLLYTILPIIIYFLINISISENHFNNILILIALSLIAITIIGWLIRLNYINPIVSDFENRELLLGYWGIRYTPSSRNADYLYPLFALAILIYFYKNYNKIIILILIYTLIFTLIMSLSRAAIIISIYIILYIIKNDKRNLKNKIINIIIIILIIIFILNSLGFENIYIIIKSIFYSKDFNQKFSNQERLSIIVDTLKYAIIHPLGVGLDCFNYIFNGSKGSNSAENAFLTILIERGWIGFIIFILIIAELIKNSFKNYQTNFNKIILPPLIIFLTFNYELNNIFANMIFLILYLDYSLRFYNE